VVFSLQFPVRPAHTELPQEKCSAFFVREGKVAGIMQNLARLSRLWRLHHLDRERALRTGRRVLAIS
jgi:hypothetical protein